jgi:hypothetical protein
MLRDAAPPEYAEWRPQLVIGAVFDSSLPESVYTHAQLWPD